MSLPALSITIRRRLGAAVAVAVTLVVAPLLAFSETTIKGILDRWLSQCIVVLDTELENSGAVLVRIHTFGEMPPSLPVTVSAKSGLIDRISLLNHVEQASAGAEPNLLIHPLANQRCPGDLCADQASSAERLTVRIKPVGTNYLYQLRVVTSKNLGPDEVRVYSRPLQGESIACRVERATAANYVARQAKEVQILFFFLGVVALTLLIGLFKRPPDGGVNDSPRVLRTLRPSDRDRR